MPWQGLGDPVSDEIIFDISPARHTDPGTSHQAAESVAVRAGSQRHMLLLAYAKAGDYGLTNDEAGVVTRLADRTGCCYWKRCGELRDAGYVTDTGRTRTSRAGEAQGVRAITPAGLAALYGEQQAAA